MMAKMFHMTMGLGMMVLAASQLHAQGNCAPRASVIERLAERYGEARRGIGMVQQGSVMEVFASDETGTWTITLTMPDGTTCLVASGQAYETVAEALPAKGDDA